MSVIFYVSNAPTHKIQCPMTECNAPESCYCDGDGTVELSVAPEFNMSNVNASQLLSVLGLDSIGELSVTSDVVDVAEKTATLNLMEGNMYWGTRFDMFVDLVDWAKDNGYSHIRWA